MSKTIKVKLRKSYIRADKRQVATVRGLGLKYINDVSELKDDACVRGMINKVSHLVEIL